MIQSSRARQEKSSTHKDDHKIASVKLGIFSKGVSTVKKKIIIFSFVLSLLLIAVFASASANTVKYGKNEQWISFLTVDKNTSETIEEKGTLQFKLPVSLTTIDEGAFEGTAITSVELPESVVVIGDYAFARIRTLRKISIPNNIQSIGKNAFKNSESITILEK